jgi:hypothetical protein
MRDTTSSEVGINLATPDFFVVVMPSRAATVSVTAPWTIHGPWRITFPYSRYGWRLKFQGLDPWKQVLVRRFVSEEWLARNPSATATSTWIETPGKEHAFGE